MTEVIKSARQFAVEWHGDQQYNGMAYVVHLDAVADILRQYGALDWQIAAGYLHDVLEDTGCTETILRAKFGDQIAGWVLAVSGVGANRKQRQAHIVSNLTVDTTGAGLLKLADRLANVTTCVANNDESLLRMYRKERELYQDIFQRASGALYRRLEALLLSAEEVACVCTLLPKDGRYLAVQRRKRPDLIGLPGGKVDAGELPVIAAARELEEETGVLVPWQELELVYCGKDEVGILAATMIAPLVAQLPEQFVGPEGTKVFFAHEADLTSAAKCEFPDYNAMLFNEYRKLLSEKGE